MKKIVSIFLAFAILITQFCVFDSRHNVMAYEIQDNQNVINGIIDYSKKLYGTSGSLLLSGLLENSGNPNADWYAVALSRYNISDDYNSYLASLTNYIDSSYQTQYKLDPVKSTEWHRIILTVLSCGGDPLSLDTKSSGQINLVSDGVYNRGNTASLGKQGLSGWVWGLIALDSMNYKIPDNSYYTRENIIHEILSQQLEDGGFSLMGTSCDADLTANVITALAPHYNENDTVRYAVDRAVNVLSDTQGTDGDFQSFGTFNAESTAQVMIALTAMNIDISSDARFIKNGNNIFDGLIRYRCDDGGFSHVQGTGQSNQMSTVQSMMALVSLYRYSTSQSSFFDFGLYDYNAHNNSTDQAQDKVQQEYQNSEVSVVAETMPENDQITVSQSKVSDTVKTDVSESEYISGKNSKAETSSVSGIFTSESDEKVSSDKISQDTSGYDKHINIKFIIFISFAVGTVLILIVCKKNIKLRNNLLIIFTLITLLILIISSTNIKSKDKYYSDNDIKKPESPAGTVNLSIDCNTILDNMDKLDSQLKNSSDISDDGQILAASEYEFYEGDSVYDILQRAVKKNKIQIAFQGSSQNSLGTVYIKSINNIYEFSCGELSGWIFTVNGKQSGKGCSDVTVSDGDVIRWAFSCDLGRDIK